MWVLDKRAQRGWHVPCRLNALYTRWSVFPPLFPLTCCELRYFNSQIFQCYKKNGTKKCILTQVVSCVRPCLHYTQNAINGIRERRTHAAPTMCINHFVPFIPMYTSVSVNECDSERGPLIRCCDAAECTRCKSAGDAYTTVCFFTPVNMKPKSFHTIRKNNADT